MVVLCCFYFFLTYLVLVCYPSQLMTRLHEIKWNAEFILNCGRYSLAQEHGDLINLHDLFQSFKATITNSSMRSKNRLKQTQSPKKRKISREPQVISDASIQYPTNFYLLAFFFFFKHFLWEIVFEVWFSFAFSWSFVFEFYISTIISSLDSYWLANDNFCTTPFLLFLYVLAGNN